MEGRISQQSNAGGSRIGDGERNIEHCEIVKQSATPARKSGAGTLPDGSNLRGMQTREVSGARQNAAPMSERDRGSISERINEMRRSVHRPRQRTERVRDEPDMLEKTEGSNKQCSKVRREQPVRICKELQARRESGSTRSWS